MTSLDAAIFAAPPASFRGAFFWSINDTVDETRLAQQIAVMHEQGQGGVFYHPRAGMTDRYLSSRFFDGVDAALDACRARGLHFYLYDEDRFPSGFAGGEVLRSSADHAALQLVREQGPNAEPRYEVRPLSSSARYDNQPYPSLLSQAAVAAFLDTTHERYAARYRHLFGSVIPAIFTDEPNVRPDRTLAAVPWAEDLPQVFRERKGYEIMDEIDLLFEPRGEYRRVRYDYWDVVSSLFEERFTRQIATWCDRHAIGLTGHFWEHAFPDPSFTGSTMPNYAAMQLPGIDVLFHPDWGRRAGETQFRNELIVRELVSTGNQLGKRRMLSETHGAGGWDYSFAAMKRMLDWQFAHGITLVCQHLSHYSLRGHRKRDFPLSFAEHQPWARSYRLLGDYIGRLSYALSRGVQCVDVVVLHPAGSTWTEWAPPAAAGVASSADANAGTATLDAMSRGVYELLASLTNVQIAWDLADEVLLERHGSVGGGPTLSVGRMAYSVVVLPPLVTVRASTMRLLSEFATAGGTILAAGRLPDHVEGRPAPGLAEQVGVGVATPAPGIVRRLESEPVERLRILECRGPRKNLIYQRRRSEGEELLFLANTGADGTLEVELDERFDGAEVWDAEEGCIVALDRHGGDAERIVLPPAGSILLRTPTSPPVRATGGSANPDARPARTAPTTAAGQVYRVIELGAEAWTVVQHGMNALVLKSCVVESDAGAGELTGALGADDEIRDAMGIERRSIFSRQPWMYTDGERAIVRPVTVSFPFRIGSLPSGRLLVALEDADRMIVRVNGSVIDTTADLGFHLDPAFRLFPIHEYCVAGDNTVDLHWDEYGLDTGLEWIAVVGDFVVRGGDARAIEPEVPLAPGEWTAQGRPYYSGSVSYLATVDIPENADLPDSGGATIGFTGLEAIAADLEVNGRFAGTMGWHPWERTIGRFLRPGANTVRLTVHNSLQNLLGPHDQEGASGIVTPGSFSGVHDTFFAPTRFDGRARIRLYGFER